MIKKLLVCVLTILVTASAGMAATLPVPSTMWFKANLNPPAIYLVNEDRCVDFAKMVKERFRNYQVGFVGVDLGSQKHMMNTVMLEDGTFLFFDYFAYKFYSPDNWDVIAYYVDYNVSQRQNKD